MLDLFSHLFGRQRNHRTLGGHSLGALPDKYDDRDLHFEIPDLTRLLGLPGSIDLRPHCSPVRDQGALGSCTGFAITALREYLENQAGYPLTVLSPLFLYYEERSLEGTIGVDAGAMIRDGFKVLAKVGAAPETDDPYDPSGFTAPPSSQALADAVNYRISAYQRIPSLLFLKAALSLQFPAVLGILVFESFESVSDGRIPVPGRFEQLLGGHAVMACGYEDDKAAPGGGWVTFKNSWGAGWGDKGYGYLPYRYVQSLKLTSDMWAGIL